MALLKVPNFRLIPGTKLFRSSKLDTLTENEVDNLKALKVITIMDLRSPEGWENPTMSSKPVIDMHYEAHAVKVSGTDKAFKYKYKKLKAMAPKDQIMQSEQHRRYFLSLIDRDFAFGLLATVVPWYYIPWILLLMVLFLLFRISLFMSEFARIAMNPIGIIGQYQGIIKYCRGSVYSTLSILADPVNVPSVICCAQGKDRTGVIAALVMSICGATREEIVNEYAATEKHLEHMTDVMRNYTASYYLAPEFDTAKATTMEALLDFIDNEYGSIKKYLNSIGFNEDKQEMLRKGVAL